MFPAWGEGGRHPNSMPALHHVCLYTEALVLIHYHVLGHTRNYQKEDRNSSTKFRLSPGWPATCGLATEDALMYPGLEWP